MKNDEHEQKRYYIQTFGCQMNFSDSERMSAYLDSLGLAGSESLDGADVLVLNTCSVKQKAEDRINGFIKNILTKFAKKPAIILTGCIARRSWQDKVAKGSSQKTSFEREDELKRFFPNVDIVIETKNFYSIGDKLAEILNDNTIKPSNRRDNPEHYLSFKPKYKSNFSAFVPISTGCNHFCTFCIVPFSRGKEVCRDANEIIREVFDLVANGFKDITLLGQTVNRWINPKFTTEYNYNEALTRIDGLNTKPMSSESLERWREFFVLKLENNEKAEIDFTATLDEPRDFLQLLQVLDQIPGIWWITWLSSHPNYMTEDLIKFIGSSWKNNLLNIEGMCDGGHQRPYLHFALQSGSDDQLRRMNRRHTISEFGQRVNQMRKEISDVSLSTDIITGFVGETDEDFVRTIEAEENFKFDMIYISEYSPRSGTAAARLKDNVPNEVKAKRKDELNEVLKRIALENGLKFKDKVIYVLVNEFDAKKGYLIGKSAQNKDVKIKSDNKSLIGKFVKVKIERITPWSFEGAVVTSHGLSLHNL